MGPAGVPRAGAGGHRRRLRRGRRRATPRCSGRRPPGAGPAAGTPSSSPSTGGAAGRSTRAFRGETAPHPRAVPDGRRTTSRSTRRVRAARHRAHRLRRARLLPRRRASAPCSSAFSARDLPDGRRGFFHPDNFTFASRSTSAAVVAAAMAVDGRALGGGRRPNRFQRWGQAGDGRAGRGPDPDGPAGDRPLRQRSRTSPRTAGSSSSMSGGL